MYYCYTTLLNFTIVTRSIKTRRELKFLDNTHRIHLELKFYMCLNLIQY